MPAQLNSSEKTSVANLTGEPEPGTDQCFFHIVTCFLKSI